MKNEECRIVVETLRVSLNLLHPLNNIVGQGLAVCPVGTPAVNFYIFRAIRESPLQMSYIVEIC